MAEETHLAEPAKAQNKRRVGKKGGSKGKRRLRMLGGMPQNKPKKIDRKMKKLYRKRARDYNSAGDDNDEDEEEEERDVGSGGESEKEEEEGLGVNGHGGNSDEGEESGRIQPGITMFVEGSRAFKKAFRSIIKKSVPEDALVSLEESIRKQRKEAFFSALGKTSKPAVDTPAKGHTSKGVVDGEGPAWAPLRDNYMLTNSKLKDWDKMPETTAVDDFGRMSEDSSSDGD
ncbi:hypothetical protein SO802_014137 [Lithocarpus litseifolius]|uniref:RRP15-like protein n=1 Tax=Lithocarpus litseifolius TaxID=425828 RepID=A0AAW2CQ79_9ROSI